MTGPAGVDATDRRVERGRSATRKLVVVMAVALLAVIVGMGTAAIEPGDNYRGRVLAPRNEPIFNCGEALDDQRRAMVLVALAGASVLTVVWVSLRRTNRV